MFKTDKDGHSEDYHPLHNWRPGLWVFTLLLFLGMGLYFIHNMDIGWTNKKVPVQFWQTQIIDDIEAKAAKNVQGIDLALITAPDEAIIKNGKEIYIGVCASCHGQQGQGDGPGGAMLNPKPRNFASADGWTNGTSLSDIYKTLQEGIKGTGMVAYEYYPEEEKFALIHYLRTLGDHYPAITDESVKTLDELYAVSSGKTIPPQIPVSKASMILVKEQSSDKDLILDLVEQIKEDCSDNVSGAVTFSEVAKCKIHALKTLKSNVQWKQSKEDFLVFLRSNIQYNGFSTKTLKLANSEFNALFDYLRTTI